MSGIGILAYGSLIGDPGREIHPLIARRIPTMTPFPVEYARLSVKSRGGAPTVVPHNAGCPVRAEVLVLNDGPSLEEAKSLLWRREVGRLDIAPEELEARNQRSAIFKTMFLAFRNAGAKDWRSQVTIALDHSGTQHKLQFHHIFPKAVLRGKYTVRETDDIANLCFIAGKTNRQISDKPPSKYFQPMIEKSGVTVFEAQCIPTESSLLDVDGYKAFLQQRRALVAQRLNEFLGTGNAESNLKSVPPQG